MAPVARARSHAHPSLQTALLFLFPHLFHNPVKSTAAASANAAHVTLSQHKTLKLAPSPDQNPEYRGSSNRSCCFLYCAFMLYNRQGAQPRQRADVWVRGQCIWGRDVWHTEGSGGRKFLCLGSLWAAAAAQPGRGTHSRAGQKIGWAAAMKSRRRATAAEGASAPRRRGIRQGIWPTDALLSRSSCAACSALGVAQSL